MDIRDYRSEDWLAICSVHDAARKDELLLSGLREAFLTLEQTAANEGLFDSKIIVAESDGKIRGFAAYFENELTWLYCDPASYRQGVGRTLLRHVINACSGSLFTEVLVGNNAALSLYESEGFNLVETSKGRLSGNETFAATAYYLERKNAA